jgi:hypothetical protein
MLGRFRPVRLWSTRVDLVLQMIRATFITVLPFSSDNQLSALPRRLISTVGWTPNLQKFRILSVGYLLIWRNKNPLGSCIYLYIYFIYDLRNYTVNGKGYITSSNEQWIRENMEGSDRGLRSYLSIFLEGLKKTTEILSASGLGADICVRDLQNTSRVLPTRPRRPASGVVL